MKTAWLITSLLASSACIADIDTARKNELLYLLQQDCGSCHGLTMKGGLGPPLLPESLAPKPVAYLVDTILQGREGTAMPPWKSMISSQEARWMVTVLQQGKLPQTQLAGGEP